MVVCTTDVHVGMYTYVTFNVPDDSIYNPGTHTKISHKQGTLSTWSAINRIEVMKTLQDVWIAEWQKVGEDIAV